MQSMPCEEGEQEQEREGESGGPDDWDEKEVRLVKLKLFGIEIELRRETTQERLERIIAERKKRRERAPPARVAQAVREALGQPGGRHLHGREEGEEMKLEEALLDVKKALCDEPCYSPPPLYCQCLYCASRRLVSAVEEHLKEDRESSHAMRRVECTS